VVRESPDYNLLNIAVLVTLFGTLLTRAVFYLKVTSPLY
jgi:hypothetical protein